MIQLELAFLDPFSFLGTTGQKLKILGNSRESRDFLFFEKLAIINTFNRILL